ncbi:MAG: hypothetical protein WCI78_05100 [Mycobacterium sp.]|jgi:hypothetical protein
MSYGRAVAAGGAVLAMALALAVEGIGIATADPYCGSGFNYDPAHAICQPGNPVPVPGLQPYPLPGQSGPGGSAPYPPYGGN